MLRLKITDDRGRKWTLCSIAEVWEAVPEERQEALVMADLGSTFKAIAVIVAVFAMVLGVTVVVTRGWGSLSAYGVLVWPLAIALPIATVSLLQWKHHGGRRAQRAVALLAALRRCAACGYDLSVIIPEPDGCRLCPECGAAWRLPASAPELPDSSADDESLFSDLQARDDRGRVVFLGAADPGERTAGKRGRRDRSAGEVVPMWAGLLFIVCLFGPWIFFVLGPFDGSNPGLPGTVVILGMSASISAGLAVVFLSTWRATGKARKRAALGAGRCPSCLHSLAGQSPEQDGCAVCPECGAAWRVPEAPSGGVNK
jgi:hypothetical protein